MKKAIVMLGVLACLCPGAGALEGFWGDLKPGEFGVGFRLHVVQDLSRFQNHLGEGTIQARQLRMYLWYPAGTDGVGITVEDYLQLYAEEGPSKRGEEYIPVQLAKGFSGSKLSAVRRLQAHARRDASPAEGTFPVIVVGQGLYYESPVTHAVLSEYLASHGYVVASVPLTGAHNKLANLSAADLEAQVRDMEFIAGQALALPFADKRNLALIGYDLGGMAGMLMTMRNPLVSAFLSLDSGILNPHSSGLPQSHPSYDERRFNRPWMHLTQERFVDGDRTSSFDRKEFGDSYLGLVPVENHGAFTIFALLGIENPVPAYWGNPESHLQKTYGEMCRLALGFFDASVKKDPRSADMLNRMSIQNSHEEHEIRLQHKVGRPQVREPQAELIDLIIDRGFEAAREKIDEQLAAVGGRNVFDEKSLAWLGYHFLYWWNRPAESVDVFALLTRAYPESAGAYSGLAKALLENSRPEEAVEALRKCLALDPDDSYAKSMMEKLASEASVVP